MAQEPWIELFNGDNLDGWTERNKSGSFRVEDGVIVGTAVEGLGTTFLCTDARYADFELEFETKVDAGLNSGVQIRSRNREPRGKQTVGPVEGPQVEIACKNPERGSFSGNIFGQGWGAWLTPKDGRRNHRLMTADWNHFRVLANGDQVTTWVNGEEVITTTIPADRHATHPSGFIGLQLHGIKEGTGPYEAAWRNLRIRALGPEDAQPEVRSKPSAAIHLKHQGPNQPFQKLPVFKDHELSFFAMAPEINCPVSVVAEPGGAVYALCDANAGLGRLANRGTVWRLVDEDDDGKADIATKFIPNIDTPRGGQFIDGTLYLAHPPFISAVRDTDGDGVADERKTLASGFAHDLSWRRGNDHSTNDLRVGIDGWIYIAVGDFGAQAVGSDGSTATLMTGGVIRMRLDGRDLEVYARGTRNTYDLAINHRLDILAMDNTNDGDGWDMRLHHLTPLAHMGYPNLYKNFSDDAMPPLFSYGGGAGCGALYLEEPGFPDWFNQRFHTISWGKLYTHDLTPNEATFTNNNTVALRINKMVDLDVDGSSRLYFANFEGGGARIDPDAIVGHIVQAKPKGWSYRAFPDLDAATTEQLLEFLNWDSGTLRQHAQWTLWQSREPGVAAALRGAAADRSLPAEARIAALYAINLRNEATAAEALKDFLSDDVLAEYALRALLDREDRAELELTPIIAELLDHENPRVRLQTVVGARKLSLNEFTEALLAMSDEAPRAPLVNGVAHVHNAIPHTARRALIELAPVQELHAALVKPELRGPSLAVLSQIHTEENVSKLIGIVNQSESPEVIAALLRLYHREKVWDGESWWGTRPRSAGPYYQGVRWEASDTIAVALRGVVARLDEDGQKATLYQVRRHNLDLDELRLPIQVDPLEQLVSQSAHTFERQADLLSIVTDPSRHPEMRVKAFRAALEVTGFPYGNWVVANLEALGAIAAEADLFDKLRYEFMQTPSHRVTLMGRVPKAWSRVKRMTPPQRSLFLDMLCQLAQSPLTTEEDRRTIVAGMGREPLTLEFVESIRRNRAVVFEPLLRKAGTVPEIAAAAKETLATFHTAAGRHVGQLPAEEVTSSVLGLSGNTEEGKRLFARQSCIACHSVNPGEPQKGPFLGSVGSLYTRGQLITHVIDPAAEVAQGFQTYSFQLKDGSVASGFVTARNEERIELRNVAGIKQDLEIADVAYEEVLDISMMPAGLVNTLTLREFASLIDYLQSLH